MDISPNDIRNYEFGTQMRGYDKDAVDDFREQVAAALEICKQENLKLSMEIDSLKSQLTGLKQFEETIKSAAIDARRNADMTIANAKQEAELMLKKAKAEAEQVLVDRTRQVSDIEEQITKLALTKKSYFAKVRSLIQSHLEMVDELVDVKGDTETQESELEITDSTEVTAKKRETVATQPSKATPLVSEEAGTSGTEDESKIDLPGTLKDVLTDEEPPKPSETPGIDPELAAALENYQKKTIETQETESEQILPAAPTTPALKLGEVVETNALAEDIPDGFVTNEEGKPVVDQNTDKMMVSQTDENQEEESGSTTQSSDASKVTPLEPQNLAKELDEVVAKFEEEMDKADKK